jgi:hypothetical protein
LIKIADRKAKQRRVFNRQSGNQQSEIAPCPTPVPRGVT